jgi:hypothetical protein
MSHSGFWHDGQMPTQDSSFVPETTSPAYRHTENAHVDHVCTLKRRKLDARQIGEIERLVSDPTIPVSQFEERLKVSRTTIYKVALAVPRQLLSLGRTRARKNHTGNHLHIGQQIGGIGRWVHGICTR